ncbi:hypothetical protein O3G_MSEX002882, partial [Manduca sexta]
MQRETMPITKEMSR